MYKRTGYRLAVCYLLVALGAACFSSTALASSVIFQFTFENDGDLSAPSYGSVEISDDTVDQLRFDITANTDVLGEGADVEQFGFNLDFSDAVTLVSGTNSATIEADKRVKGRNSRFDWVVDFGQGQPFFSSASFIIEGSGLNLDAISLTDSGISSQNNKPDAQFMAHIQSTSTSSGSESIGGMNIPIPAVAWLFPAGLITGLGWMRRKAT